MSTIQNLKNFIRHGKQARDPGPSTTTTATTHAHAISEPAGMAQVHYADGHKNQDFTVVGGQAGAGFVAKADHQAAQRQQQNQNYDDAADQKEALERIVAEERESKGRLPKYPD